MCMGIAEAAHECATPALDNRGTLQRLRCEFAANADDTFSLDEYIPSVRCCTSGIDDIDVNECNACIITARSDFHIRNFQTKVCLGLVEQSVGCSISQWSYFYQIDSTERRMAGIPCLSQSVCIHRLGGLQGSTRCHHPIRRQYDGWGLAGALNEPSRGHPCAHRRDGSWIPTDRVFIKQHPSQLDY